MDSNGLSSLQKLICIFTQFLKNTKLNALILFFIRSKTQGLQETKDRLQAKLIDLKKIVDEAKNRFKLAESELKIYVSNEQKEVEKLEKMKEAYNRANATLEEKKP